MRALLLIALSLLLPAQGWALSYVKKRLDNGLVVLLARRNTPGLVSSYVWYKVGSFHEPPGRSGFAHFFEHYMFKGTRHVSEDDLFRFVNGSGGTINATTSHDRTDYIAEIGANAVERWLQIDAGRMAHLEFDQGRFDEERNVVLNELGMRSNRPMGMQVSNVFMRNAFPAGHPYSRPLGGTPEELMAATLGDAEQFYKTFYWPDNAVLVVAGDIDYSRTMEYVERWFGRLEPSPGPIPAPSAASFDGPPSKSRDVITDAHGRMPALRMAWRIPGARDPGNMELQLFARLFGGGADSQLQRALVDTGEALSASAGTQGLNHGDLFSLQVMTRPRPGETPEKALARVEAAVRRELQSAARGPIDGGALKGAARALEFAILNAHQDSSTLARSMAECEAFEGDPTCFERELEAVRSASPGAVAAAARERLIPSAESVLWILPGGR